MPSKILRPFTADGRRIIDIIIDGARATGLPVVVATTVNPADDIIAQAARNGGAECFRGPEEDVLSRFTGAADAFGIDRMVRVCSDNPFLDFTSVHPLLEAQRATGADYTAYAWPDRRPTIQSHIGLFPELVTTDALRRAAAVANESLWREHVTIYLYTHPEEFTLRLLDMPRPLSTRTDLRLTLDTPSDFALLSDLYALWEAEKSHGTETLLRIIDSDPRYGAIMKQNIALNSK